MSVIIDFVVLGVVVSFVRMFQNDTNVLIPSGIDRPTYFSSNDDVSNYFNDEIVYSLTGGRKKNATKESSNNNNDKNNKQKVRKSLFDKMKKKEEEETVSCRCDDTNKMDDNKKKDSFSEKVFIERIEKIISEKIIYQPTKKEKAKKKNNEIENIIVSSCNTTNTTNNGDNENKNTTNLLLLLLGGMIGGILSFVAGLLFNRRSSSDKKEDFLLPATAEYRRYSPPIEYPTYDLDRPKDSFIQICDMLIDELLVDLTLNYKLPQRERDWLYNMMQYNIKGGKMNRGLIVVNTGIDILRHNKQNNLPTDDTTNNTTLCRLAVLGWCVEWMQTWLLMTDDVMDSIDMRRGKKTWYRKLDDDYEGGSWSIAINDAFTMESLVYKVIKRHFGYDPSLCYSIIDIMTETTLQTELGQLYDTLCNNVIPLKDFTPQRWKQIVQYKTAYYSFYLSTALAIMFMSSKGEQKKKEVYDAVRDLVIEMGTYFQARDDYMDCYAAPEKLGKVGTDIIDRKCTWLFTKAYHDVLLQQQRQQQKQRRLSSINTNNKDKNKNNETESMIELLEHKYGNCDTKEEEKQIKELYVTLGIPKMYQKYERESYQKIQSMKESYEKLLENVGIPWSIFENFIRKFYAGVHPDDEDTKNNGTTMKKESQQATSK